MRLSVHALRLAVVVCGCAILTEVVAQEPVTVRVHSTQPCGGSVHSFGLKDSDLKSFANLAKLFSSRASVLAMPYYVDVTARLWISKTSKRGQVDISVHSTVDISCPTAHCWIANADGKVDMGMKIVFASKVDLDVDLQVTYEAKGSGSFGTSARVGTWMTSRTGKLTVPLKIKLNKGVPTSIPVSSSIDVKANATNTYAYSVSSNLTIRATWDAGELSVDPMGKSCGGTSIAPQTADFGKPVVLGLRGGRANGLAILHVADDSNRLGPFSLPLDLGPLGAPGCSIYVNSSIVLPYQLDASGAVDATLQVPSIPASQFMPLRFQWTHATNSNSLGLLLTGARRVVRRY